MVLLGRARTILATVVVTISTFSTLARIALTRSHAGVAAGEFFSQSCQISLTRPVTTVTLSSGSR